LGVACLAAEAHDVEPLDRQHLAERQAEAVQENLKHEIVVKLEVGDNLGAVVERGNQAVAELNRWLTQKGDQPVVTIDDVLGIASGLACHQSADEALAGADPLLIRRDIKVVPNSLHRTRVEEGTPTRKRNHKPSAGNIDPRRRLPGARRDQAPSGWWGTLWSARTVANGDN
jgi:CTP:molybdopterin cytidylyltransferase MocA